MAVLEMMKILDRNATRLVRRTREGKINYAMFLEDHSNQNTTY